MYCVVFVVIGLANPSESFSVFYGERTMWCKCSYSITDTLGNIMDLILLLHRSCPLEFLL